ncbi:helix-turn-helix domain-containing protein [Chryseobacterium sp. SSA4.19]|uniref:AraC family transcriptional regulator n=1 Tax=Chryseobacterium sp. SSA4.19 TaxID=2919915 RepID=UPI001F4DA5A8|nr:helix-turn-helix domain-containing protein [Chryseobacterium sp. SSA4.19]MCJ8152777.1 helix-turn-helix domain-containing protein [Chryseobacterium sp. SSA4.19]
MNHSIQTLLLSQLNKGHPLQNELLIFTVDDFFEHIASGQHYKNKFYSVFLLNEGSGSVIIDDEEFTVQPERFFFVNYHQIYQFRLSAAKGYVLMFTKSFYNYVYTGNKLIRSDAILTDVPPYIDLSRTSRKDVWQNFEAIHREFVNNKMLFKEILCLLVKVFILKYIRNANTFLKFNRSVDHKKDLVDRFSDLVNTHFKELKTTAPYAEQLNITPNYLNALVKEQLDLTAGRFIKDRIILEAERLLLHTTFSITEIAYELGFNDNSHFGKYFKSVKKISPNRYRLKKTRL